MLPVIAEISVTPAVDCDAAPGFRKPAIVESSWPTFAPEYLTLLKLTSAVPFTARMMAAEVTDDSGPLARRLRFIVPAPLTLSSDVTPYALAIERIAGSCALGARTLAFTVGDGAV